MRVHPLLLVLLLLPALGQPAFARSILTEQNDAASARDAYGDAISKLDDIRQKIKSQQELVNREQEKLKQYQADEVQAQQDLETKKSTFEQKSKTLDNAWKQRNDY
ncbi:hypothetical protein SAMN05192566_0165 [Methylophilus rhizosphaerae]|uniref:Uncharacterized protein n=1 Tax=Methylophilus rhizosphaerae TaxID=492660 RepID=A0A1G8Z9F1_9PROT|nr:hypothetical protein [Methylophilus rhizosphaerae]SDK11613.1 hypothetical protein SAMN05192566_0165 [Methylophilus rhizosphaerae]